MNKILLTFALMFTTSMSHAQEILLHGPFSATGTYQALIRHIETGLADKGWALNVKITGNPKLSRDTFNESDEPMILAWGTETSGSKSDPHYIQPADQSDMIGFTHLTGMYLCSTKPITQEQFLKNSYKIAITQDAFYKNWVESWQEYLGTKHKFIQYSGSSKAGNALFSGEVDFAFSSRGAGYVDANKAQCLLTTQPMSVVNVPTVKSVFPEYKDNVAVHGMFWRAKNFSPEMLEKFRKDFAEVKKEFEPFKQFMKGKHYLQVSDPIDSQVKLAQDLDSKLQ